MTVFAVWIKTASTRWIDSMWVEEAKADKRVDSLGDTFEAFHLTHNAFVVKLKLEDGVLGEPK